MKSYEKFVGECVTLAVVVMKRSLKKLTAQCPKGYNRSYQNLFFFVSPFESPFVNNSFSNPRSSMSGYFCWLKRQSAQNFMRCAERFSNFATLQNLNYSQMIQLLSLPAEETEKFIAAKKAEGNPAMSRDLKYSQVADRFDKTVGVDRFKASQSVSEKRL